MQGAWLGLGLLLASACVEPARSADVPPDFAPRIASGAAAGAALGKKQPSKVADAHPLAGKESDAEPNVKADASAPQTVDFNPPGVDAFMGQTDAPIREALRNKGFLTVEKGRGGRSLGFKVTLEGGQKGYFKGEQIFSAANWFGEVAAYHLDRMLGLGRVPAVVSRQVAWTQLEPAVGADWRRSEMIIRNGQLRGAFVAWVDGGVRPMTSQEGWERWVRVKYWPTSAVSPFQRPAVWVQEVTQAKRMGIEWRSKDERARLRNLRPEPDRPDRPSELSDLIVFDYLIRNLDRWGGGNANVVTRGDKGPLIFLDNAAGFEPGEPRPSLMEARLHALQRFRRRTIAAVKSFDIKKFEARLSTESLQPVLGPGQIEGLEMRRKALLSWVAELEAAYGEAIWAWE